MTLGSPSPLLPFLNAAFVAFLQTETVTKLVDCLIREEVLFSDNVEVEG